jgi:hypothetical protein
MSEVIVKVGMASCGMAAGAGDVYRKLSEYLAANPLPVKTAENSLHRDVF